jgi:hypothetical protein
VTALDGTQFSLTNTPQIRRTVRKARTRRGPAAFAKLTTCVLLEVGLHNPLAAGIGRAGESEWALALRLVAQLPPGVLLLADRLYGVGAFVTQVAARCAAVGSHFLIRARPDVKPRVLRRLADGSRLIRVLLRDRGQPARIVGTWEGREIRVRVGRPGHRSHALRLWTSLANWRTAPASELAQVYASRWEHELYFRDLKRQLRKTAVLQSHTVETAAQEVAAVILVSALIATERARAAPHHVAVVRVSFAKVLDWVRASWLAVTQFDDVMTTRQMATYFRRVYQQMAGCLTAKRRPRTCVRAVRQPTKAWPRVLRPQSVTGPFRLTVV